MMLEDPAIDIRVLKQSDIAAGMRLKELASWNQTEQDWERLLRLSPVGCFCATINGEVVGTSTTTAYERELAWIGMVLVHPQYRRRGIGSRLMHAALDHLNDDEVATVKLDATQQGRPVYEGMGFRFESRIERWQGTAHEFFRANCTPISHSEVEEILTLDRAAFAADRSKLIEMLIEAACATSITANSAGLIQGYALARRGSNAIYLGPVIATNVQHAELLLDCLLGQLTGKQIYIDVNTEFEGAREIVSSRGLVKQRDLDRMAYGKPASSTSQLVFAIAGPELG